MSHINDPSRLPPVGCRLLIFLDDGEVILAVRTGYISKPTDNLEYKLVKYDRVIKGRFKWMYP